MLNFGLEKEFVLCWEILMVTLEDLYKAMLECMVVSDGGSAIEMVNEFWSWLIVLT